MKKFDVENLVYRLVDLIFKKYINESVATDLQLHLMHKLQTKEYSLIGSSVEFRRQLNTDLFKISNDEHLAISAISDEQDNSQLEIEQNYGFEDVKILQGNIGYINLTAFCETKYAAKTAISAMKKISDSDGLIFDLRKNGGGYPDMVQLLSSYLFSEKPILLNECYRREKDSKQQFWTLAQIEGKRLAQIPVTILTSKDTFSAAEEFCYNLKALNRVTIIGEKTRGGAQPGEVHKISRELSVFVPNGRAINPTTGSNWEGAGISPDIETKAADALNIAYEMFAKNTKKHQPN